MPHRRSAPQRAEELSAGGLVVEDTGDAVFGAVIGKHDRRGRLVWSLPKGHVEPGESLEQAAAREVSEETGLAGEVVGPLGTVDYWFSQDGRRVHKTVHHFLLRRVAGELSDSDCEVAEVAWLPLDELAERLAYVDERRLIRAAPRMLARTG